MRINLFSVVIDKSTIVFQQRIIPYCNWQFAFIFAKLMAFYLDMRLVSKNTPPSILQMKTI